MADENTLLKLQDLMLNTDKDNKTVSPEVDAFYQSTPVGPLSTAIGDTFYGINHRLTPNPIPINRDHYGLTFFTRPLLNLTSGNIRYVRQLAPLLTTQSMSIQRAIRFLLDREVGKIETLDCPIIDNQQAFIPILTDTLLSMSGWPDMEAPTFTSQEGMYKESYSMVDGITSIYRTYDIQASFRNIPGDPITMLFLVWLQYASAVFQGTMVPYSKFIVENEIDYQTRIYRLVLDSTRTYVQKIAACGAAFPTAVPIGGAFNFEADRPLNGTNDQITIPFRCMGALYQDDILIQEFNQTVEDFNQGMQTGERESFYIKIPTNELPLFNHRGYPRINPSTYELEWWIEQDTYISTLQNPYFEPAITPSDSRN